jgi:DNA-binding transcriptional LysR family regulator
MGVAFLPEWTVDDDLAAGRLARVLPAYTVPPLTRYAVYTNRQYMTPKLRTFIDFFSEALGGGKSVAQ